jgi:uncharacterized protein YlxW (UPF0749 family)
VHVFFQSFVCLLVGGNGGATWAERHAEQQRQEQQRQEQQHVAELTKQRQELECQMKELKLKQEQEERAKAAMPPQAAVKADPDQKPAAKPGLKKPPPGSVPPASC